MRINEIYPDLTDPSLLPPGGSPLWDRTYERWVVEFIAEVSPEVLDRLTGPDGEVHGQPDRVINPFKLTHHLFKWVIGWAFPSGTGPNFSHRLRFLSIQFHYRRAEFEAEAQRYVEQQIAVLRDKHRP
jgi:hypothetical protein